MRKKSPLYDVEIEDRGRSLVVRFKASRKSHATFSFSIDREEDIRFLRNVLANPQSGAIGAPLHLVEESRSG